MTTAIQRVEPDMSLAQLGEAFAKSGYFTDAREAAQAIVKIQTGREIGFGPVSSMTGINIVKGRVTMSAWIMAASIKRSGRYSYRIRELTDQRCTIEFFESGESAGVSTFAIEDAQKAGLLKGDNWKNYPRNMLFSRALSNGAKWYCPDVFAGPAYTPDELGVEVDIEPGEVPPAVEPARPAPAATPAPAAQPSHAAPVPPPATSAPATPPPVAPIRTHAEVINPDGSRTPVQAEVIGTPSRPAPAPQQSVSSVARLKEMVRIHNITPEQVGGWCRHFNVDELDQLADEDVARIIKRIEEKLNLVNAAY